MSNIVSLALARAEKILTDYCDGTTSHEETIAKLISAFDLEQSDAEMLLREVDARDA